MRIFRAIVGLAVILMFAANAQALVKVGSMAAPFTLNGLDGKPVDVKFDKKVTVVSFWVSSCALCVNELGTLNQLAEKFNGKDAQIVVVSTDFGGSAIVNIVIERTGLDIKAPIVFDEGMKISGAGFGATQFPVLFVVDKGGKISYLHEGWQDDSEARILSEIEYRLR